MLNSVVGKPFLDDRYLTLEGTAVNFTASSFDIICVLADLDEDEISHWRQSSFNYGIFKEGGIPFFVTDFGKGLLLSCPFNIRNVKAKHLINWLMLTDNYINLFLIEKKGYILKASRTVALEPLFMRSLKNMLRNQYFKYGSEKEILSRIDDLQHKYNVEYMFQKTELYTAT
jgi:hypothetical protein